MAVNKLVSVLDPSGLLPALVEAEIRRLIHGETIAGAMVEVTAEFDSGDGPETYTMSADDLLSGMLSLSTGIVNLESTKAGIDPSTGKMYAFLAPDVSIVDFKGEVANEAAMLAVVGENGDYVIRTDTNTMWTIVRTPSNVLANWVQWRTPASPVQSVAGKIGEVTLVASDITNSTTVGRALLTAPSADTARTTIGAAKVGPAATDAMRGDKNRIVASLPASPDPDLIYFVPEV